MLDPTEESVRFEEGVLSNFLCDIVCYDNSELEGIQSSDMALLMGFTFSGKTKLPVCIGNTNKFCILYQFDYSFLGRRLYLGQFDECFSCVSTNYCC